MTNEVLKINTIHLNYFILFFKLNLSPVDNIILYFLHLNVLMLSVTGRHLSGMITHLVEMYFSIVFYIFQKHFVIHLCGKFLSVVFVTPLAGIVW